MNADGSSAISGNQGTNALSPRTPDASLCPHSLAEADNERAAVSPLRCVDCDTCTGTSYFNN